MATRARGRILGGGGSGTRRTSTSYNKVSGNSNRGTRGNTGNTEAHNAVFFAPWLVVILCAIVGQLVYFSFDSVGQWIWLAYIGLVSATLLVTYAAWHTTKSRSNLALWHTLATVIGTGIWLMFAATTGLVQLGYVSWWLWRLPLPVHPTFDIWWMFGGAAALAWNIRQGVGREHARDDVDDDDVWSQCSVPGVKGTIKPVNEFKMQGVVTLPPSMTVEALQHALPALESGHGWARKSARILPMPGTQRIGQRHKALVTVMLKDPLAVSVAWPGVVIKRGMNLMSLIPTGVDQNGDESGLWVVQEEGTKHALIQGITGSGKSLGENPIILYTAALGAVNIILDTVKKTQTFGPIASALHWLAVDEGLAKAILRRIAKEVIPARTEYLAYEGLAQWSLKSKLSLVRLHIEEAWSLIESDEIVPIALAARSAGIQLTMSLQVAKHNMIDTTVREQLGVRRCYGLGGAFGSMILDDDVLDAGADPEKWKDNAPGMHYMQRGKLTLEEKVFERRSYYDSGSITFAQAALQIGPKLKPMDEITAAAFGPVWANRTTPLEVVAKVGASYSNVTRKTGEAFKAMSTAVVHPASADVDAFEESEDPLSTPTVPTELLAFMAHTAGCTAAEMRQAVEIYTEREGDVEGIINGTENIEDGDGVGDPDVIDHDDFVTEERTDGGQTLTLSTPGLSNLVIDFGEDAPDEEDLARLASVDPDAKEKPRSPDEPPLRFGLADGPKWEKERFDNALVTRFNELKTAGRTVVKSSDFMDIVAEAGWTRTIIYPRLLSWENEGLVTKTSDGFVLVRG